MAIEKNSFKVARFDPQYHSPNSKEARMSSDEEDMQRRNSSSMVVSDGEDDDEYNDCDSGAGSDDFDLLELGETGEEFCQVGDQTCSIPYELYDLPGLKDILSMDVWNEVLTEEERFGLAKYLPDMDQEDFVRTLKELFSGDNLHFGNPVTKLFDMLKGGLCEPRVAMYRQGSQFLKLRKYYHQLQTHQNTMVNNACQVRDAWVNCKGYSIDEKLKVLTVMKSQSSLVNENMEEFKSDSTDKEDSGDGLWGKKSKATKLGQKTVRYSGHNAALDLSSRGRKAAMESAKHGKQNHRGTMKLAGVGTSLMKEALDPFTSPSHIVETKLGRYGVGLASHRYNNPIDHDSPIAAKINDPARFIENDDDRERMYEVAVHRDQNYHGVGIKDKRGDFRYGKKHDRPRAADETDSFMGVPLTRRNDVHALGRNKTINQLSDIRVLTAKPSHSRNIHDVGDHVKYNENLQQFTPENFMKLGNAQKTSISSRVNEAEFVDDEGNTEWFRTSGGLLPADSSNKHSDTRARAKKWKMGRAVDPNAINKECIDEGDPEWFRVSGGLVPADSSYKHSDSSTRAKKWKMGRESVDPNASNKLLHPNFRPKTSKNKSRANSLQNERREGLGNSGMSMFPRSEDTESDSSDQMDEDEDENPLMRSKWAYPGGVPDLRYGPDMKKGKLSKREKKDGYVTPDGSGRSSQKMGDYGQNLQMMAAEQKGKTHDVGHLNTFFTNNLEVAAFPGPGSLIGQQRFYPLGQNGLSEVYHGENFCMPSLNSSLLQTRRLHGDFGLPPPNNMHDPGFEDESFWSQPLAANYGVPLKLGKRGQIAEFPNGHYPERSDVPLMGCNSLPKKRKAKGEFVYMGVQDNSEYLHADGQLRDDNSSLRKRGKNKVEDVPDALENGFSEPPIMEMEIEEVEIEIKPPKKPLPLITPTVHTGFSFSIIHLLSAVRMAMITLLPDDSLAAEKHPDKSDSGEPAKEEEEVNMKEDESGMDVNTSTPPAEVNTSTTPAEASTSTPPAEANTSTPPAEANTSTQPAEANLPSLTIDELVNRVKSSPGDPCILETQEPLQDLVRGVLKIFASRTAPLGAKGWKPLVLYQKLTKSWSWIGPASHRSSDSEAVEEVTSADAWNLPHKMLVKLVDSFANWLKNSQETLQQIGSLPPPPLELTQNGLDEKERFKDLRAQKSLSTIGISSEEVRAYFRKEEMLRYLIPDRAFSYTAIDGKKSVVAPLRRGGGKPTSKARDHFMLKRDRPPHVTILCLVRDAASRLPGTIGTRSDVCTLIRDSQYVVEDVSDTQVNQVVSGALDRLHYERDPCVLYDGERKLWVYLHRDREEEDFEDDGTSSTKKWRRQKKEKPSDQGDVTIAYTEAVDQSKFDLVSDLNVEASCAEDDKRSEPDYHIGNDLEEDNPETSHGSDPGMHHDLTSLMWNDLQMDPVEGQSLGCQDNFTNGEFDEDAFGGDQPP